MARTMTAKYDGKCADCGGRVYAGDRVVWHGRGQGVSHADGDTCFSYAEQAAEMRMEQWAEARLMGYAATAMEEGWFD